MRRDIVLVDENDREIGNGEKMEVHRLGKKHRAFSILIFNFKGEMLIQKRSKEKYHSGGLWSNTSCGHPKPGEDILNAGERRLFEEMGIKVKLSEKFVFLYKITLENGLVENEVDHVLFGFGDNLKIEPSLSEVSDWKWVGIKDLEADIEKDPSIYTKWFPLIIGQLKNYDF